MPQKSSQTGKEDGETITKHVADHWLTDPAAVSLSTFRLLDDEAAQVLAKHKGDLYLEGLEELSKASASHLSGVGGDLVLDGLATLDDDVAEALAAHQGNLFLNGLPALSDNAARAFAAHEGGLWLDGLAHLSDEAAAALAQHGGDLSLGITTLSEKAATSLAASTAFISLGVTSLSNAAADALAAHKGEGIDLSSIKHVSGPALNSLLSNTKIRLPAGMAVDPRIRKLWEKANASPPTDVLAVLWEKNGAPDWDRRSSISQKLYPEIPGGYEGDLARPAVASWTVTTIDNAVHFNIKIIHASGDFPVQELLTKARASIEDGSAISPLIIAAETRSPTTDSECEYFGGDENA